MRMKTPATLSIPESEQLIINHSKDGIRHFIKYAETLHYYVLNAEFLPDMETFFGMNQETGTFFVSDSIPRDIRREILIIEWSRQCSKNSLYAPHISASLNFDSGRLGFSLAQTLAKFFKQILATFEEVQDENLEKPRDLQNALDLCERYMGSRAV